jgi:hypothetical protein
MDVRYLSDQQFGFPYCISIACTLIG